MTQKKKLKRRIRQRQGRTQERYTTARRQVLKSEGEKQGSQRPQPDPLREAARAHGALVVKSCRSAAAKAIESLAAKSYPSAAAKAIELLATKSYASAGKAIDSLATESYASVAKTIDSLASGAVTASMDPLRMLQRELECAAFALQRQLVTNPALVVQKHIEEQMTAACAPINELQWAFRETERLLRPL